MKFTKPAFVLVNVFGENVNGQDGVWCKFERCSGFGDGVFLEMECFLRWSVFGDGLWIMCFGDGVRFWIVIASMASTPCRSNEIS